MKINPKVTGALAWTGLVLVLAVPAADMLGGKPEAKTALTSDMDQIQTSSVKPIAPQPVKTGAVAPALGGDPVTDFVKSGKKMPSYISGNDAPVVEEASAPKAPVKKPGTITINPDGTIAKPTAADEEPVVASIKPDAVAPVPLPASRRPLPQTVTTLPQTATVQPQTVTTLPAPTEAPLIIDENQVASTGPVPPAEIVPEDQLVTADELDEWDSGSLADYLARKGLMSDASQTNAPSSAEYDSDGFYLSDGPNRPRRSRAYISD
jgi:hypothetical protein